jgi:hypothetical protein
MATPVHTSSHINSYIRQFSDELTSILGMHGADLVAAS